MWDSSHSSYWNFFMNSFWDPFRNPTSPSFSITSKTSPGFFQELLPWFFLDFFWDCFKNLFRYSSGNFSRDPFRNCFTDFFRNFSQGSSRISPRVAYAIPADPSGILVNFGNLLAVSNGNPPGKYLKEFLLQFLFSELFKKLKEFIEKIFQQVHASFLQQFLPGFHFSKNIFCKSKKLVKTF